MSATYEWAWHGRERYDKEMSILHSLCDKHGIKYVSIPFDEFVTQFKKNSEEYYADLRKRGKLQGAQCEWNELSVKFCEVEMHPMIPTVNVFLLLAKILIIGIWSANWYFKNIPMPLRMIYIGVLFNVYIRIVLFVCYMHLTFCTLLCILMWRSLSSRSLNRL